MASRRTEGALGPLVSQVRFGGCAGDWLDYAWIVLLGVCGLGSVALAVALATT